MPLPADRYRVGTVLGFVTWSRFLGFAWRVYLCVMSSGTDGDTTPSSQFLLPPLDLVHRAGHMGDEDPHGAYLRFGRRLRAQMEAILPPS